MKPGGGFSGKVIYNFEEVYGMKSFNEAGASLFIDLSNYHNYSNYFN